MQIGKSNISFNIKENPLIIWRDTNKKLNEFYKRPNVNLTDSPEDLELKNIMRHITGLARVAQVNSPDVARAYGYTKEMFDFGKDYIKHPFSKRSSDVVNDTNIDFFDNDLGINYIQNNPNASVEDIMNYAYQEALKSKTREYPKSDLFQYLSY